MLAYAALALILFAMGVMAKKSSPEDTAMIPLTIEAMGADEEWRSLVLDTLDRRLDQHFASGELSRPINMAGLFELMLG